MENPPAVARAARERELQAFRRTIGDEKKSNRPAVLRASVGGSQHERPVSPVTTQSRSTPATGVLEILWNNICFLCGPFRLTATGIGPHPHQNSHIRHKYVQIIRNAADCQGLESSVRTNVGTFWDVVWPGAFLVEFWQRGPLD